MTQTKTTEYTNDNERINAIVQDVAARYGFKDATATFTPLAEFKVNWTRALVWIHLDFSDYLTVLPDRALKSLVNTLLAAIRTEDQAQYSAQLAHAISTKKFLRANQKTYINRHRPVTGPILENAPDLYAAYDRLVETGKLERDPDLKLCWAKLPEETVTYRASGVFKTAFFNTSLFLDWAGNPWTLDEECLEYIVYCAAIRAQYAFGDSNIHEEISLRLAEYPDRDELLLRLADLAFAGDELE